MPAPDAARPAGPPTPLGRVVARPRRTAPATPRPPGQPVGTGTAVSAAGAYGAATGRGTPTAEAAALDRSVAETSPAAGAAAACPIDPEAARAALDERLTAVVRGRTSVREFRAWWNRDAAGGLLGALTSAEDPRGRAAVDRCREALAEHRKRQIDEEELLDSLVLAREALRG